MSASSVEANGAAPRAAGAKADRAEPEATGVAAGAAVDEPAAEATLAAGAGPDGATLGAPDGDLAAALYLILSTLTRTAPDGAADPSERLLDQLAIIQWLRVELAAAEQVVSAALQTAAEGEAGADRAEEPPEPAG